MRLQGFGKNVEESSSSKYNIADICDEGTQILNCEETETVESIPDSSGKKNQIEKNKFKTLVEFCRIDGETVSKDYLYEILKDLYHKQDQYLYQCNVIIVKEAPKHQVLPVSGQ